MFFIVKGVKYCGPRGQNVCSGSYGNVLLRSPFNAELSVPGEDCSLLPASSCYCLQAPHQLSCHNHALPRQPSPMADPSRGTRTWLFPCNLGLTSWEIFAVDLPLGFPEEFPNPHCSRRFSLSNPASVGLPSHREGCTPWFGAFPAQSHFHFLLSFESITNQKTFCVPISISAPASQRTQLIQCLLTLFFCGQSYSTRFLRMHTLQLFSCMHICMYVFWMSIHEYTYISFKNFMYLFLCIPIPKSLSST